MGRDDVGSTMLGDESAVSMTFEHPDHLPPSTVRKRVVNMVQKTRHGTT